MAVESQWGLARHQEKGLGKKRVRNQQSSIVVVDSNKRRKLCDLPVEILSDILSRLPVSSLLVAKKACTLLESIINDPVFSQSLKTPPGHLYTLASDSNLYFAQDATTTIKLSGELGDQNRYSSFSSCRGLLCYRSIPDKSVYICNPLIPSHRFVKLPHLNSDALTWGFGYAPLTKKYKYLQFSVFQPKMRFTAAVFTLGDQTWREVTLLSDVHPWRSPVYCNGSLHWSVTSWSAHHDSKHGVLSFDLDTEKIRPRRLLPTNAATRSCSATYLTVLGESLAFVVRSPGGLQQVWMLIDEAEDIWVQKYCIYAPTPRPDSSNLDFKLSGIWTNQELYGVETAFTKARRNQVGLGSVYHKVTQRRCLSYNADRETYTAIQLPFAKDGTSPQLLIAHVGNLISPSEIVSTPTEQPSLAAG